MIRKEWREVGQQSLYFVLALACVPLLLAWLADLLQGRPFDGEKAAIMAGLWMLMFSMFLGLSPFAMDSKQKGMEYLLTLPVSRRRLLLIKFLPRLAAIVFFFCMYALLYRSLGNQAFGGGAVFFSLIYFALFFISFSLSVADENFIVQSISAGIALGGYTVLCLFVVMLGMSWKFKVPAAQVVSGVWHDLSYDPPTLLVSIVVFILLAAPFVLSLFLAFRKFDLRGGRAFNRRQLLIFVPLLLLAFAASLGVTYLVQNSSPGWESNLFVLKNQRLLKGTFPGKLTLYDDAGRRKVDTNSRIYWERLLMEQGERLYMSGYDTESGERIIGCLNQADLSWKTVHRVPERYFVANGYMGIRFDGKDFVYLRRYPPEADRPGMDSNQVVRSGVLELVRVDPSDGASTTIRFRSPLFRKYYQPWFIGSDERNGLHFWLIAHQWHNVLRLWEDGRVDDLGVSKGFPAYAANLLFTRSDHSLVVRRLLAVGTETVKEIEGNFELFSPYRSFLLGKQASEIYVKRDKRIVRIDLASLTVDDIGPERGSIWVVSPGDCYYVEFETWPGRANDNWKKLYRLQGGKLVFLKQFDFQDEGYGHISVDTFGVILRQMKMISATESRTRARFFAFPDLRELHFKGLD